MSFAAGWLIMEELRQQLLRDLAERQAQQAQDPSQQELAQGTLELLDYVGQLVNELQIATESCCEAMSIVYENVL